MRTSDAVVAVHAFATVRGRVITAVTVLEEGRPSRPSRLPKSATQQLRAEQSVQIGAVPVAQLPSSQSSNIRVFGLDVLRASAICMVLISHARFNFRSLQVPVSESPLRHLRLGGFFGVELFFVLSGFLIGGILVELLPTLNRFSTLRTFWYRRWMRTLPNYFLFLAITLFLAPGRPAPAAGEVWPYILFTQNFAWRHPAFFAEAWSLSVEEWFYLLFPLTLFFALRTKAEECAARRFVAVTLVFLLIPGVARCVWVAATQPEWDESVRKLVVFRLDAVMCGVLAAWLKASFPGHWNRIGRKALLAGGLLLAVAAWIFDTSDVNTNFGARTWLFSLVSLGFSLLLPSCDGWRAPRGSFLTRAVESVALWSYSLYLCNLSILYALQSASGVTGPFRLSGDLARCALFLGLSFACAALVYNFFERPILRLRDRRKAVRAPNESPEKIAALR